MRSRQPSLLDRLVDKVILRLSLSVAYSRPILQTVLWKRAIEDSADFVEKHMKDALVFGRRMDILNHTALKIKEQKIDGVCLEFGVYKGFSINYFAKRFQELEFVGFDSFEGLAEDWTGHLFGKGAFDAGGKLPKVFSNVALVKGWFDQTFPKYCKNHLIKKSVRFISIDCDTYNATSLVLECLSCHLKPGVLILFDEYVGYPNWRNGEFRAWQEISKKYKINFRHLSFASEQALIEIIN